MNLISLNEQDFTTSDRVVLSNRRFAHIKQVLKADVGKKLQVGLINGLMGYGEVKNIGASEVELSIVLNKKPPEPAPVSLILSLPRPKSLPRIVQTITSLGVKRVAFINSWKVEKCYWSSDYLSKEVIDKAILLGLEQSVDTVTPEIDFFKLFKPFVEDSLAEWCGDGQKLVCHPHGAGGLSESPRTKTILALGPEGGFIDYELEQFSLQGFEQYSLVDRVLKLETAIPALVSRFYRGQTN